MTELTPDFTSPVAKMIQNAMDKYGVLNSFEVSDGYDTTQYMDVPDEGVCLVIGCWYEEDRFWLVWNYRSHLIVDRTMRRKPRIVNGIDPPYTTGWMSNFGPEARRESYAIRCCEIANESEQAWNEYFGIGAIT